MRGASDDRPRVAAADQAGQPVLGRVRGGGGRGGDLRARLVVVRRPLDLAEDADRRLVEVAGVGQPRDRERGARVLVVGVVDQQGVLADLGHQRHLDAAGGGPDQALVALAVLAGLAEPDRLAVLERDDRVGLGVLVLDRVERAVVEDRAVLVDLDERGASVRGRRGQHRGEVLAVGVDGAGHEGALGAERQRDRVERVVQRAHRRRLGDLAGLRGGGVLALGQAVDPVVEQQDRHVHVAAQRVDQVVAADRQRVAVTGDHEHRQVLARGRDAGRDRRRPAVDRVHAVGVEVVREPRGAPDAGDEDDVLAADAQLGQEPLDRLEHGVVTAPGAPADLLVGRELLGGLRLVAGRDAAQPGEGQLDGH